MAWAAVGLRMLKDSSVFCHYVAAIVVLTGAITTMLPAWVHAWVPIHRYVGYRPAMLLVDNILQVICTLYLKTGWKLLAVRKFCTTAAINCSTAEHDLNMNESAGQLGLLHTRSHLSRGIIVLA
jgi:hypothetical protein